MGEGKTADLCGGTGGGGHNTAAGGRKRGSKGAKEGQCPAAASQVRCPVQRISTEQKVPSNRSSAEVQRKADDGSLTLVIIFSGGAGWEGVSHRGER